MVDKVVWEKVRPHLYNFIYDVLLTKQELSF